VLKDHSQPALISINLTWRSRLGHEPAEECNQEEIYQKAGNRHTPWDVSTDDKPNANRAYDGIKNQHAF